MPITYLTGDATVPCKNSGIRIITHVNNDAGDGGEVLFLLYLPSGRSRWLGTKHGITTLYLAV